MEGVSTASRRAEPALEGLFGVRRRREGNAAYLGRLLVSEATALCLRRQPNCHTRQSCVLAPCFEHARKACVRRIRGVFVLINLAGSSHTPFLRPSLSHVVIAWVVSGAGIGDAKRGRGGVNVAPETDGPQG